ncbi:MAG: type III restriction endonuclease, partial [bacterium]|nr:type III restriction endonuclease [bacterium]
KELKFKNKGIKVLSLFFIDRVDNYRSYDEEGNPKKGKLAQWFEDAFIKVSEKRFFKGLLPYPVEELHDGYFSVDNKKGKIVSLKDTTGKTGKDEETYQLIMKDKERLLSPDVPLRFIFSHSALKEGWDNPNVFQICTLREMGTDRERRQTLGRGLRLPVNRDGERVFDDTINKLTVIAGESFEDYARGLQDDIEKDCCITFGRLKPIAFANLFDETNRNQIGQETSRLIWEALIQNGYLDSSGDITGKFVPGNLDFRLQLPAQFEPLRAAITDEMKRYIFKNRIVNARERRSLQYNKRVELNDDFNILWQKINKKTRYSVQFDTAELVSRTVAKIKKMKPIEPVRIFVDKTEVDIREAGVEGVKSFGGRMITARPHNHLPDILAFLQGETELTRSTLVDILKQSRRLKEFILNPQAFMTETAKLVNR